MPDDLLSRFVQLRDSVLVGIQNEDRQAQKYKTTLGLINQIFLTTHGMAVSIIEDLERPKSVEIARLVLSQLNWEPLTESFHVEGLCWPLCPEHSAARGPLGQRVG